jgi:hypothetical protein
MASTNCNRNDPINRTAYILPLNIMKFYDVWLLNNKTARADPDFDH